MDVYGDHLAACPRTGLLARRAGPVERAWARVGREAGGRVVHKQLLRDTNVAPLRIGDRRQLDAVIYGITRNGVPVCCDATVVSPIQRDGRPRGRAADVNGWALRVAVRRKHRRYPELVGSSRGTLAVLGAEVGGRWNTDAIRLVQRCARLRARSAPQLLRASAIAAWSTRWWGILSVAVQDSLAACIGREGHLAFGGHEEDPELPLAEVLLLAAQPVAQSRLPFRG